MLGVHTTVGQNSWNQAWTLMCLSRCYLQSRRIWDVFLCSCIREPLQDLHFTLFICKPRSCMELLVLFWLWLFFFPHLKTHVPNTTRRMPGKTLLKKDSSLPSIMTNVMRKREGLSVVRLNMSSLTLSLGSICLHNQCCMLCAIWPYFARTPTVSHTQRNHNISLRVTWYSWHAQNHCLQIDHSILPFLPLVISFCSFLCFSATGAPK